MIADSKELDARRFWWEFMMSGREWLPGNRWRRTHVRACIAAAREVDHVRFILDGGRS